MTKSATSFVINSLYSSEEIQTALEVGNAGGVRVCLKKDGTVKRLVVMTSDVSARQAKENPYHDRIEGSVLVYTGAGREGDQTLAGMNQRIPQQLLNPFPIYGFILIGSRRDKKIGPKRWRFLGLLQYTRHYPETQVDVRLAKRQVWLFEMRIHGTPQEIPPAIDAALSAKVLSEARAREPDSENDREIVNPPALVQSPKADPLLIESIRSQLLGLEPQSFEHIVKDTLLRVGFDRVEVTQYSQDGGIDVNALAGPNLWPLKDMMLQAQAKRWLHTVGRREVAELRGSLQPHARGLVVTTSHFSRAAILEATEPGKLPIVLMDGFAFASVVHAYQLKL